MSEFLEISKLEKLCTKRLVTYFKLVKSYSPKSWYINKNDKFYLYLKSIKDLLDKREHINKKK